MKVGELLKFGPYEWRVLEIKDDRVLLLTEYIVEQRSYHPSFEEVTWETCELRHYLNNEFINKFSEVDQERILTVKNSNCDNPWYKTSGGSDTYDKVFLLDIHDVVSKYFGDSTEILENRRPSDRYWFGKNDKNNILRYTTLDGYGFWWWLRTPGRNNKTAVYIHGNPKGCLGINGNNVFSKSYTESRYGGIRPAIWISFKEDN